MVSYLFTAFDYSHSLIFQVGGLFQSLLQRLVGSPTRHLMADGITYEDLFTEIGLTEQKDFDAACAGLEQYIAASNGSACIASRLSQSELVAIKLYTSNHIYRQLNVAFRTGVDGRAARAYSQLMTAAIARRPWAHGGILFRGMSATPATMLTANPDVVIVLRGLTSLSVQQDVAERFTAPGGCLWHVATISGGSYVTDVSVIAGEAEVLFTSGMMLVVEYVVATAGVSHIYLRQVTSAIGFGTVIMS